MHKAEAFELLTADKTTISATLHTHAEKSPHLIIIGPATGAPQYYYHGFAKYASQYKDFDVLTFDYRGIGKSLKGSVKDAKATMTDWGAQDLAAAIRWGDKRYDKICLIGHSVAGQIFPKAPNNDRILAAYFVGSQTAYYGKWRGLWLLYVLIFWYVLIPITTALYNYLPGWTMGGKIAVPKPAAKEWRRWGIHPEGVLQGDPQMAKRFANVKIPLHFVSIQDDKLLAPGRATQALMHYYKNAVTSFQFIKPKDLKLSKIGHFGFFKKEFRKQLWPMPIFFFSQYINKLDE
ncbi:alpha/beta hydrolase family protein [Marinoscillum furvescens]|uniref:Putative alpha/beta hydrolase n=1 Tax=Marinoscillum furvescens DSM 4134 TaxID=1122208 RepID=A0A3D9L5N9_MARFU|nr:alpha/beta fold hydrolase [Marinoscillum furvescens]RED99851.1 putative alpha/beta hydrolase [Marinoscillum furvescens DSM 4134]